MRENLSRFDFNLEKSMKAHLLHEAQKNQSFMQNNIALLKEKIASAQFELRSNQIELNEVNQYRQARQQAFKQFNQQLTQTMQQKLRLNINQFESIVGQLDAKSPLKKMSQGYLYASKEGKTITSIDDLEKGDVFNLRVIDGIIKAELLEKEANNGKI